MWWRGTVTLRDQPEAESGEQGGESGMQRGDLTGNGGG